MSRTVTLGALVLTAAVSFGLYQLSYRVQGQEDTLLKLNRTLNRDREAIEVLKAEWSYLSRPDALQQEADRFLALAPLQPSQILSPDQIAALPAADLFPPADAAVPLPLPRPPAPGVKPAPGLQNVPVARRLIPHPPRRAALAETIKGPEPAAALPVLAPILVNAEAASPADAGVAR